MSWNPIQGETVNIWVKASYDSGDFELIAQDSCGQVIAADTFREPVNALTAVDKIREQYPEATVTYGKLP